MIFAELTPWKRVMRMAVFLVNNILIPPFSRLTWNFINMLSIQYTLHWKLMQIALSKDCYMETMVKTGITYWDLNILIEQRM